MADGGHLENMSNLNISKTSGPLSMNHVVLMHISLPDLYGLQKFKL